MCNIETNICFSWKLVSQFVSWDFCRYMCEQSQDDNNSDSDVLTFLRNMIVQRTEKPVSDITKHEIVAKFIMETKAIRDVSRMPCILTLSEIVIKICPELNSAVSKLVNHLETFLNVLDYNEESHKEELIKLRIDDAINDFCKEAKSLLPAPDLLKVVEAWNHHHERTHQRSKKKVIYSSMVLENVLECLHFETITPSEAKLIAVALHEDKEFERILASAVAEAETVADSDQFSFQSSQAQDNVFSQEFTKNVQTCKSNEIPPTQCGDLGQLNVPDGPADLPELPNLPIENSDDILQFTDDGFITTAFSPLKSPLLNRLPADNSRSSLSSISENHQVNSNTPKKFYQKNSQNNQNSSSNSSRNSNQKVPENYLNNGNSRRALQKVLDNYHYNTPSKSLNAQKNHHNKGSPGRSLQNGSANHIFAQSSAHSSDSDDPPYNLLHHSSSRIQNRSGRQVIENESDSDTSDCEKNAEYRFLTPTLFKENGKNPPARFIYISDNESNDSSVITATCESQKDDPNWSSKNAHIPAFYPPKQRKKELTQNTQKKKTKFLDVSAVNSDDSPVPGCSKQKNNARILDTDSDNSVHYSPVAKRQADGPRRLVPKGPSEPPSKKTKGVKLYRSPNTSIQDFLPQLRRPMPTTSVGVPVHVGTNTRNRKEPVQSKKDSSRTKKCKHCKKSYKTVIALRRHIFLEHTAPADGGSD